MTRVKPGERQKRKTPKVRTGCVLCKLRRIKCDETKPACIRCSSAGRPCEYRNHPTPKYEVQTWFKAHLEGNSILACPSTRPSMKSQEVRCLQFFIERTAPELTGIVSQPFWTRAVIQLAQIESSIAHAIFALASYHEGYQNPHQSPSEKVFAINHYNMAVKGILKSSPSMSRAHTNLISCLIFLLIEMLQRNYSSAFQLFPYGRRILDHWQHEVELQTYVSPTIREIMHLAGSLYIRLSIQVFELFHGGKPTFTIDSIPNLRVLNVAPDFRFTSLTEAQDTLTHLSVDLWRARITVGVNNLGKFRQRLEMWLAAFDNFTEQLSHGVENRAVAMLKCRAMFYKTILTPTDPSNVLHTSVQDKWFHDCMEIVNLAALALGVKNTGSVPLVPLLIQQSNLHSQLNADQGVISILHAVVIWCRDPVVRRRAIELMKCAPLQEGGWNRTISLQTANHIVKMEESGQNRVRSAEDIPCEVRVTTVSFHLSANRDQAAVRLTSPRGSWDEEISLAKMY
ncbi:hypothetical protein BX600DRAFT_473607 [Xylariales sp. PMI_506]|nr:hypothetical protein BX600DRAFT_473607 [Xylariales sp. PMI_506]